MELQPTRYMNDLPDGFASAIYDAPLAVRVEVDGRYLADAMVVLDRHDRVTLTQMMAGAESTIPLERRNEYEAVLRRGLTLGTCSGLDCRAGIVRSAFGLADSKLALFTDRGAADAAGATYLTPPARGSGGAVLSHGLSLVSDPGGGASSLNYDLSISSNLGSWTAYSDLQVIYEHYRSFGGFGGDQWRKYLNDAYLQREFHGYYARAGIFAPDNSTDQGNLAPLPYAGADTIAGFSIGSSDTLLRSDRHASMIPLTVNANRAGRVEIYKDGRMLATRVVQPGVTELPTEDLPNGIYTVEVRLYEGNQLVSSMPESIYKPTNWNGRSRWRFRVYGGRRFAPWDGAFDDTGRGDWAGGAQLGYLLTPRLRGGVTVSYQGDDTPVGLFVDYQFNDSARLYVNPYYSSRRGSGFEVQGTLRAGTASLAVTHRYAQVKYSRRVRTYDGSPLPVYTDISRYSSVVGSWQINEHNRLSTSLRFDHVHAQHTIDLSFYRDLVTHGGTQIQAFVSLYDRPAAWSGHDIRQREHGVMIGLTGTFGRGSDQFNVSTGAGRTAAGLDRSVNLGYQHNFAHGAVQSIDVAGNYARGGSSATASARFSARHLSGDGYVQYATGSGDASLGLNLRSTTAIGGWAIGEAASDLGAARSAVVLDVGADGAALPAGLVARMSDGQFVTLHAGRNLVAVDPYRTAHLSFDQLDGKTGGVRFRPESMSVQLYPGGVVHRKLDAIRTITVVGRVVDANGRPRTGIRIVNHAGQAWPESDGVFTMEVSRQQPTIEIFDGGRDVCHVDLRHRIVRPDASGVAVLGDLTCR